MAERSPVPRIVPLPNGPYYFISDFEPKPVPYLRSSDGKSRATIRAVALCRCGGSQNKPFCDGTHGRIGFSDARDPARVTDRRDDYVAPEITIHDNRGICAHAGHCTDGLPEVFRLGGEPWIEPEGADAARIVATIRQCPSGALSYSREGTLHRDRDGPPCITVTRDGPYAVSGGIELAWEDWAEGASREHYTLCRCGGSKNKPFCDGTHWHIGFRDEAN